MMDTRYSFQDSSSFSHLPNREAASGFSLIEAMVAVSISLITLGAAMTLNGQQLKLVKSTRESNASSLLLQDRVEQFRILSWKSFTDAAYLRDHFISTRPTAAALLPNVSEQVKVEAYPDPTVCRPILVEYSAGSSPTILLSGAGLPDQRMAKVDMVVTWTGKDNRQRTRSYASIISNSGVSRTNLPAFGAPAGGQPTSSTPTTTSSTPTSSTPTPTPTSSTPTPTPTSATPTPTPTGNGNGNGNGRGNAGGQSGKK